MLCIMLVKIMAFIFHFYSSKILGRKRNLYQGGERQSKKRRREGFRDSEYF